VGFGGAPWEAMKLDEVTGMGLLWTTRARALSLALSMEGHSEAAV
jgi:hypothetical protein